MPEPFVIYSRFTYVDAPYIFILLHRLRPALPVCADDSEREINALILAIEQSGCQFIRNGDSHSAAEAAEHLRLKYRKGKAYAKTAEEFIDNLASQSSLTKSPYYLITPQGEKITSRVWLQQTLKRLRGEQSSRQHN